MLRPIAVSVRRPSRQLAGDTITRGRSLTKEALRVVAAGALASTENEKALSRREIS